MVSPGRALCHCIVAEEVTMACLCTSRDVTWTNHVQIFCIKVQQYYLSRLQPRQNDSADVAADAADDMMLVTVAVCDSLI